MNYIRLEIAERFEFLFSSMLRPYGCFTNIYFMLVINAPPSILPSHPPTTTLPSNLIHHMPTTTTTTTTTTKTTTATTATTTTFFFKQKTAYEMLRSLVGSEMCIRDM